MDQQNIYQKIHQSTDQDHNSIYWGKRFHTTYWGRVSHNSFKIRPVVPYWNISPLEIQGTVKKGEEGKTLVNMRMVCPFLRVILPLAILGVVLFFVSQGIKGNMDVFINSSVMILLGAYLMVNIPFQIQAARNVGDLIKRLEGKPKWIK
ncbi:MAG: hypothetical protein ACLFM7_01870 [Bacteroidales bacterium]